MKKIVFLVAIGTFAMAGSCKKVDSLSNVDPASAPVSSTTGAPENVTPTTVPAPIPEAQTPPPANGKYPVMTFEKKEHDFGVIAADSKVTYTFNFKNTGESDLLISNAVGSCGCTVPEFPKEPIKPGESGKMKVSFNSEGKNGNQQKTVTVSANTQSGKEIVTIKASITPKAESGITAH